jgi:Spy/CpxP family protein refolding chaperone
MARWLRPFAAAGRHAAPRVRGLAKRSARLALVAVLLPALASGQVSRSPYAGQGGREVKALDPAEVEALLAGQGMGFAKAAELNHYPGPAHVTQLAAQLRLTDEQRRAIQALHAAMQREAVRLGRAIVDLERALDQAFAEQTIDEPRLRGLVSEIARLEGVLRVVHLAAHIETKRLLSPEQVNAYDRLRGYTGGAAHEGHGAAGHAGGEGGHGR